VRAINDVIGVAEWVDKRVSERARYKYLIELAAVVAAAGLVTNLLAGYSSHDNSSLLEYAGSHYPAVGFAILGIIIALFLVVRIWYRTKQIP
jgi:uncharacterized membrane protein